MKASSNCRLNHGKLLQNGNFMLYSTLVQASPLALSGQKKTLPTEELKPKGDLGLGGDRSKPLNASLSSVDFQYLISLKLLSLPKAHAAYARVRPLYGLVV
jgi:hypothetical protein